jgi:ribosomal protein S6--L-glutamate ligase
MHNLIIVNGERYWQSYFPGYNVQYRRLQTSKWLYHDEKLWVFDQSGAVRVDSVFWRLGAVKPHPNHRAVLELIRLAGVPCVNPPDVLLRGYDRLAMLNELRSAQLPLLNFSAAVGERVLDQIVPDLPAVLKVGNYHGGFGKARAITPEQWADLSDLSFISEDYVTIEPYIEYIRDIRCLAIGTELWAMERRGVGWKVNTQTASYGLIAVPSNAADYTRQAMAHFGADMLGVDFLQTAEGDVFVLESNDIPGLDGFPEAVRIAAANRLREKIEAA